MIPIAIINDWPGGARVLKGLADIKAGRDTENSCLVRIAAPRLRRAGLFDDGDHGSPELELYQILRKEPNAYSRYNALLRELVSFEHSLDAYESRNL